MAIRFTDGFPELVRSTKLSRVTDAQFWETSATADGPNVRVFKVGPPLPARQIRVVQASGGHQSPTFYVGDQRDNLVEPGSAAPGLALDGRHDRLAADRPGPPPPAAGRPPGRRSASSSTRTART